MENNVLQYTYFIYILQFKCNNTYYNTFSDLFGALKRMRMN